MTMRRSKVLQSWVHYQSMLELGAAGSVDSRRQIGQLVIHMRYHDNSHFLEYTPVESATGLADFARMRTKEDQSTALQLAA